MRSRLSFRDTDTSHMATRNTRARKILYFMFKQIENLDRYVDDMNRKEFSMMEFCNFN